jgi:hypothetical protein
MIIRAVPVVFVITSRLFFVIAVRLPLSLRALPLCYSEGALRLCHQALSPAHSEPVEECTPVQDKLRDRRIPHSSR